VHVIAHGRRREGFEISVIGVAIDEPDNPVVAIDLDAVVRPLVARTEIEDRRAKGLAALDLEMSVVRTFGTTRGVD